jgi:hypothetical protein
VISIVVGFTQGSEIICVFTISCCKNVLFIVKYRMDSCLLLKMKEFNTSVDFVPYSAIDHGLTCSLVSSGSRH